MLKTLFQISYSVVLSPLLAFFVKQGQGIHRALVSPLLSGPLKGALVEEVQNEIYRLEKGEISEEEFITNVADCMTKAATDGQLAPWLNAADERTQNLDITLKRCLGYAPLKWWYVKLHFMAPGNVHGLHAHRNVISAQVILRGSVVASQYDLLSDLKQSPAKLKLISEGEVRFPGKLLATDSMANVHGFEPGAEGALRFQFYLRGHSSLRKRLPERGRLYVNLRDGVLPDGVRLADIGESGRAGES